MKKLLDFLKINFIIAKWTFWYFLVIWLILKYIFNFDMFSQLYWWKFFHTQSHGFIGFVLTALIYTIIPIYIATTIVMYRTKEPIIKIVFVNKVCDCIKNLIATKPKAEPIPEEPTEEQTKPDFEYPDDLPHEMRVPFRRIKEHMALTSNTVQSNTFAPQQKTPLNEPEQQTQPEAFPIPTDFDIENDTTDNNFDNKVPTFTEINFDEPKKPSEPSNKMTEYLKNNNIEFETFNDFIITKKHLMYVHNDPDFWIFDDDNWFAAGKQIESPVSVMQKMAKDEELMPIIYFESTNIMDFDGTVQKLQEQGIVVITEPSELNNL